MCLSKIEGKVFQKGSKRKDRQQITK